jgi:hypothetical protein
MLQYLVDDYLGGYRLPRIRTTSVFFRLVVNEKGEQWLVGNGSNNPIKRLHTKVVAIRSWARLGTYILYSDMTECWMCELNSGVSVSTETIQCYLESSE